MVISNWRDSSILAHIPRAVELLRDKPDFAIYAGAATSARILAAIVISIPDFQDSCTFDTVLSDVGDPSGETTLCESTYIYGLEMLAVLATLLVLRGRLMGENITIYVGNSNAKDALVNGISKTQAIDRIIRIFGHTRKP